MTIQSETPHDDEPTCPNIGSALDAAVYAFNRYLFELEHVWEHLAAGVREQDVSQIEAAAKVLVGAWGGACAAAQRIEAHAADAQARSQTAWFAVRAHGRALGDLCQRALCETPHDSALYALLKQLSLQIPRPQHNARGADDIETRGSAGNGVSGPLVVARRDDDDRGSGRE